MEKDWMLNPMPRGLGRSPRGLRTRGLGAWSCLFGDWRSGSPELGARSCSSRQPAVWAAQVGSPLLFV